MEQLKFREKCAIGNNRSIEIRNFVSVSDVQSQLSEAFRTDAERAINVAFHRCGLSSVRLSAIHEKYPPCWRNVPGATIGVLLDALLDDAEYKMFVSMPRELVLDIMCVNQFGAIGIAKLIYQNPLRRSRHTEEACRGRA